MDDATRLLQATLTEAKQGEPMHSGPVFAAPFHAMGDASQVPYTYARAHNPTWTELETALSGLEGEGSQCFVFPTGMAAIASIFGTVLRPGDVAVLPSNAYYVARKLMETYFVEMGVTLRMAPTANNAQAALLDGAKLLWLETPSNPTMEVCDIAKLCDAAHKAGALVAVDNSTPTALSQKPLLLGADFSVASDAKAMSGHSDILYGHVAVKDVALGAKILEWRRLTGSALGPMEAWLAMRSLATLPLRLERSSENAMRLAEFLKTRSDVMNVLYPGLKTHPDHALAARQMRYFGPVLSFTLPSEAKADEFLTRAKLITQATSFGSVVTTAERRARWGGDDVAPGFIRLSAGCEAIDDLLADIAQALDAVK
ncbi:MAG TPA: cystathionine gamma-lyase [Acidobacteriaceae bacterium]|jgi:cystathionine gamma-lyase|nr:cystathionine gamma-lyase [Acidobacteriaceae bacterium]